MSLGKIRNNVRLLNKLIKAVHERNKQRHCYDKYTANDCQTSEKPASVRAFFI